MSTPENTQSMEYYRRLLLRGSKRLRFWRLSYHPITVFTFLQVLLIAVIALWLTWYFRSQTTFAKIKVALGKDIFNDDLMMMSLVLGCTFLGIILVGTSALFIAVIRERRLNSQQKNFLSSVSHELRSPLASMQLSLETLQKHQLDDATRAKLYTMLSKDRERLFRMVEQILVSTRLELGKTHLESFKKVRLKQFIENICLQSVHMDAHLAARLKVTIADDLMMVVPTAAMALVLTNLVENAIKYSPAGTPIVIEALWREPNLQLTVTDQGFGLDRTERKKIFKMFQRGELAYEKAIPGTGLGLYIVKAIVKMLDGKVFVKSPGRNLGTSFIVLLPADTVEAPLQ